MNLLKKLTDRASDSSLSLPSPTRLETLEPRLLFSATLLDSGDTGMLHGSGCCCSSCSGQEGHYHDGQYFDSFDHEGHFQFEGHDLHALPPADASFTLAGSPGLVEDTDILEYAPLSETFFLNSNPDASHTIYLDFNGHTTTGTTWNSYTGVSSFDTPVFSFEGDDSFSDNELQRIQSIWQRVAEDFIPFDVNVTTQDPGLDALERSGSGDTDWGVRVAIGGSSHDWYGVDAGGVAFVDSFNWSSDTPTYVFTDQLGNGNEKFTAEAISHEVGHTLGLDHDGVGSQSYYNGHGSGETGWAAILGAGYYQNLTQWSKGEYTNASNTQDDLAIITSQNGFGYRIDDHGNTINTATALDISGTSVSGSGLIERNTDADLFSFTTGGGNVSLDIDPAARGANLDILAELLDSSGNVIASSNPFGELSASINADLSAGTYFLRISGTGEGDPSSTGYSDYGSLGQYTITGTIQAATVLPSLAIGDVTVDEAAGTASFTVSLNNASDSLITVNASTANLSAAAGSDFVGKSETLVFNPGETSKTFTVSLIDDEVDELAETLAVNLSGASGALISDAQGVGTIVDNDVAPVVPVYASISDASVTEPDVFNKGKNKGQAKTTTISFKISLSATTSEAVSLNWTTADGSALAGSDYTAASGTAVIAAGATSTTITITVIGDVAVEGNEQFSVQITDVNGASLADGTAVATIVDNDSASSGTDGDGGGGGGTKGGGKGRNKAAVVDDYTANSEFTSDDYYMAAAYQFYTNNLFTNDVGFGAQQAEDKAEGLDTVFERFELV